MFDQKAYMREYAKRLKTERRAAGVCVKCGRATDGKASCADCRKKDLGRQTKRQEARAAEGRCKSCGKPKGGDGKVYCPACLKKAEGWNRVHRARHKAKGLCLACGKESGGKTRCPDCAVKSVAAAREARERYAAAGLCRNCGKEAVTSKVSMHGRVRENGRGTHCRDCYLKIMASGLLGSGTKWEILLQKLDACGWVCPYTGVALVMGDNLSFDHMDPVGRFPEKRHDPENVEPCSWQANLMKRDLTKAEFLKMIEAIHLHQRQKG